MRDGVIRVAQERSSSFQSPATEVLMWGFTERRAKLPRKVRTREVCRSRDIRNGQRLLVVRVDEIARSKQMARQFRTALLTSVSLSTGSRHHTSAQDSTVHT